MGEGVVYNKKSEATDMKHESKLIALSLLEINPENPRYEIVESQVEAFSIMIERGGDKLFNLAQDIAINGLNPTQLIMVKPSQKKEKMFCVLEGNRRITALKFLDNVNRIPDKYESLRRRFKRIANDFEKDPITEVNCIVYTDREKANKWIKLRHTGENKGRGIVPWSAYQTARFEQRNEGKSSYALQVIDYLKADDGFNLTLKEKLEDDIAFTSLERLLGDPGFRNHIGLDMVNKRIQSKYPEDEIRKPLAKVISDISKPGFNVKKIYHKEDRKDYYTEFDKKDDLPDKTKEKHPWDIVTKEPHKETKQKTQKSKPPSTARTTLIPRSCKLSIDQTRINDIYHELKKLKLDTFVNAASVIFRVFIELSVNTFIQRSPLAEHEGEKLRSKIQRVAKYFEETKQLKPKQLKPIRTAVTNPNTLLSINTFNAYTHNEYQHPSENDLKTAWAKYEPFIAKIWETE